MTVARLYVMRAAEGKAAALEKALGDAAELVRKVPGNEGVELLRDVEAEGSLLFIEKWDSIESHKQAFAHLPEGALDAVQSAMAGPPEGTYLEYVKTI